MRLKDLYKLKEVIVLFDYQKKSDIKVFSSQIELREWFIKEIIEESLIFNPELAKQFKSRGINNIYEPNFNELDIYLEFFGYYMYKCPFIS